MPDPNGNLREEKPVSSFKELIRFLSTRSIFSRSVNQDGTPINPATKEGQDNLNTTVEKSSKDVGIHFNGNRDDIAAAFFSMLRGDKGDSIEGPAGHTPTKDELRKLITPLIPRPIKGDTGDTPTNQQLLKLIRPLIPTVVDGHTPTTEELTRLVVPLIPPVKHGRIPNHEWNEDKTKVRFESEFGWGDWSASLRGHKGTGAEGTASSSGSGQKGLASYFSGASVFTALVDTPDSYVGHALKVVRVNAAENALEFSVAGSGTVGPGTINEIAYFDTTSSIASLAVATYPSLTQLSYVKGVTSAIQTQLDANVSTADSNAIVYAIALG